MRTIEEIMKDFQKVRLSEVERASMRSLLDNHIRSRPLPSGIPSPLFHFEFFFRRHVLALGFAAILFISSTGALLAERALPGDVLYGLKRGVNEEVRGWFADSPEDRALWQLSLAERRLSEIQTLSKQNKLSDKVQSELSAEVDEYTESLLQEEGEADLVFGDSETSTTSTLATVAADGSREEEGFSAASSMKISFPAEAGDEETEEGEEETYLTFEEIDRLEKEIERGRESIQKNKTPQDQRMFIRSKGLLLMAEKMIFESKQALKKGNEGMARELFLSAESTFESVYGEAQEVPLVEEEILEELPAGDEEEGVRPKEEALEGGSPETGLPHGIVNP